jgi:proteic killer suppression protein
MIRSFKDKDTEAIFNGLFVRRVPREITPIAARKLNQLYAAVRLDDLRVPPGNQLEALKGDRKGQHSIRINDQWRICFVWTDAGVEAVEIVDYH